MKATVTFDITIPPDVTINQLLEFLSYTLRMIGECSEKNPLIEMDELKPVFLNVGTCPDK